MVFIVTAVLKGKDIDQVYQPRRTISDVYLRNLLVSLWARSGKLGGKLKQYPVTCLLPGKI